MHQVGDLFELNVKLRCQKVKRSRPNAVLGTGELWSDVYIDTVFLIMYTGFWIHFLSEVIPAAVELVYCSDMHSDVQRCFLHRGLSYCSVNVTVVVDKDFVFYDSAPLGSCHRFEELDDSIFTAVFLWLPLKMETSSLSETPITVYSPRWHHIQEDLNLYERCCYNLKSSNIVVVWSVLACGLD